MRIFSEHRINSPKKQSRKGSFKPHTDKNSRPRFAADCNRSNILHMIPAKATGNLTVFKFIQARLSAQATDAAADLNSYH